MRVREVVLCQLSTLLTLAAFVISVLFSGLANAECLDSEDLSEFQLRYNAPGASKLNSDIETIFQTYRCLDRKIYFDVLNYRLEVAEKGTDNSASLKYAIADLRHKLQLPEYDDPIRLLQSDKERIAEFRKAYFEIKKNPKPSNIKRAVQNRHFIVVRGFLNELVGQSYFETFAQILRADYGLADGNIHTLSTHSFNGSDDSSIELVHDKYLQIKKNDPNSEILLFGHSRGGLIILKTLHLYKEMIHDPKLLRVVTIQSPLKGASEANDIVSALDQLETLCGDFCYAENFKAVFYRVSVLTSDSTYQFAKTLQTSFDINDLSEFSSKLYYVTTELRKDRAFPSKVDDGLSQRGDGTVALHSQFLRSVGHHLAYLPGVAHKDLVLNRPLSHLTFEERRAFYITLVEQLENTL